MASWNMWYANGWWNVECYYDNGNLVSVGSAGHVVGAQELVEACCGGMVGSNGGTGVFPHAHGFKGNATGGFGPRPVIRSFGIKQMAKSGEPKCRMPLKLITDLVNEGYTGFRQIALSPTEDAIQFGKVQLG